MLATVASTTTNTAYNSTSLPLMLRTPLMPRCYPRHKAQASKDRPEAKVLIDIEFAHDLPYSTKATVEAL